MAEKFADLKIRATDQFSATLEKGRAAVEKFAQSASRKDVLVAIRAQRAELGKLRSDVEQMSSTYAEYDRKVRDGGGSAQLGAEMFQLRVKILEAKNAIQEKSRALSVLRGQSGSFVAFSQAADKSRAAFEASGAAVDKLRARITELRAEQERASASAASYLRNQSTASRVGGNFGAANLSIGNEFAKEAAEARRAIRGLEADLHQMERASRGSFLEFSKNADAMKATGTSAAKASVDLGKLSEAEKNLDRAVKQTANAQQRAAAQARELRASREVLVAKYGAESAQVKQLDAALVVLDRRSDGLAQSQGSLRSSVDSATAALNRQRIAANKAGDAYVKQGRQAKQNWGSDVIGEDQEVMAFGLRPYQLTNLGYQVNDVVSGVAMGQAPMQIFAQQIGQLLQIFPAFSRGMMGFFKILERFPAITGVAGVAIGAFVTAIVRVKRESGQFDAAMAGAANSLALFADSANYTQEGLAKAALRMKDYAGSLEESMKIVRQFQKLGIREDRFVQLTESASKFASLTGQEMPQATEQLAKAFSGGFESLRDFDRQLNIFTASEMEAIRAMYEAGDAANAQEYAFNLINIKMEEMGTQAAGPWAKAFSALGSAWGSFVGWLADTAAVEVAVQVMDELAMAVEGVGNAIDWVFSKPPATADGLLLQIEKMENAIAQVQATIESNDSMGLGFFNSLYDYDSVVAVLTKDLEELRAEYAKIADFDGAPGLSAENLEALRKSYQDFAAKIADVNEQRAFETELVGLSNRETEIATEIQQRLNEAIEQGLTSLPEWAELWEVETAKIRASIDAKYDAVEAQQRLEDAERAGQQIVAQTRTERERANEVIRDTEEAIRILTDAYGENDPRVRAAAAALDRFRAEANSATDSAYDLADAARELGAALANIGSFNADLDNRLVRAQNQISSLKSGVSEASYRADEMVRRETDKLIAAGASADAVAKAYTDLMPKAEQVVALEKERSELANKVFNPPKPRASRGGGGRTKEIDAEKDAEQRLNAVLEYRRTLVEEIKRLEGMGNTEGAEALRLKLNEVNVEALTAIDNMIAFYAAAGGVEADTAILKLQAVKDEIKSAGQEAIITKEQVDNMIADGVGNAFTSFAEAIANGENAIKSLRQAFLQFAADFLIKIGQMIVQAALLKALQSSGFGGMISGGVNGIFMHTGGIVGQGGLATRTVSPSIFAGATRYHTGGVVGLKPNERPIVAEVGEEVLTEDDPRHRKNGGGAQQQPVTIINAVDGSDALEQALATDRGRRAIMNMVRSNRDTFRAALG